MERWRHSRFGFECAYCAAILEDFESDICQKCQAELASQDEGDKGCSCSYNHLKGA